VPPCTAAAIGTAIVKDQEPRALHRLRIRAAAATEIGLVRAKYAEWHYDGAVTAQETVLLAECAEALLGMVRQTYEHGTVMLRGMQVDPAARGTGIGTALLQAFVARLGGRECYCLPYSHLMNFYGKQGFEPCAPTAAPPFLRQRLQQYRARGLDVVIMRRRRQAD
jgi:GNAT superfamily N-acetyltransferase